jgi:hypothetical protein
MTELEIELMRVLVKLVVHHRDGWDRIESALESVYETGIELEAERKPKLSLIRTSIPDNHRITLQ